MAISFECPDIKQVKLVVSQMLDVTFTVNPFYYEIV